uniref:COP1-interacting protein 7 n=1 Tax=Noccaea caerulescens TaxID=107243 RepID=A0A1J3IVX0_NOCCA
MDSRAILDSALFQLTPTRTRFDLVLFCGSKKEKLASGIFEPFVSHLKFARDQISKGGYSISLHPPTSHSSWFTKSTFDRFVRFVNTPAIIERFATLEKEILQIENSIQANEIAANAALAEQIQDGSNVKKLNESSKKESENGNEAAGEETSKIQLQRLLETRRTLLRREQAMAYARGAVAGYEIDSIDDLILFADAFGASRLREACVKYKDLWKKKHGDGLWMAELAAVKAIAPADMSLLGSSGIILTNEGAAALSLNGTDSSNASSETKDDKSVNLDQHPPGVPSFQAPPMGWPNHMPHYYYPPPYQGYPYPPMHPMPNQNQGNMPWPSKGKTSKKKGKGDSDRDVSSGSSESSESDDSCSDDSASSLEEQGKRHSRRSKKNRKKKSSKTVIIRNINYITPEGRNGDMEGNEFTENGSIKETVDAAVGFLRENKAYEAEVSGSGDEILKSSAEVKKSNENWDSFQNILMRHDDGSDVQSMEVVSEEHFTHRGSNGLQAKKNNASGDSIIVAHKHIENGGGRTFDHFESEDGARRVTRTRDSTEECMLLLKRSDMLGGDESKDMYNGTNGGSLVKKSGSGEDWFTSGAGKPEGNYGRMSFDESCILTSEGSDHKSRKQEFVDDSFMVHSSSLTGDDLYDSRWRPDMSADIALASDVENGQANEKRGSWEPNDLCMILERNSGDSLANNDYSIDFSAEANARLSSNGTTAQEKEEKTVSSGEKKNPEARKSRTPIRTRGETMSKTAKKPTVANRTMAQKNKFEKEEEMRKRIESLVLERQRRIAERSAATASRKASNRAPSVREKAAT